MIGKKSILLLALATLLVFGGLGIAFISLVQGTDILRFLQGDGRIWLQIVIGVIFGIITAKAGWQIVELPLLTKIRQFFSGIIQPMQLNTTEIIVISLCAGIGEELFFRGAVQPLLGVWTTAILFVLLHGYLNPFNMPMMYYGLYMVLVIGVIGLLAENFGILTAIISHAVIDYILLVELSKVELPTNDGKSDL